MGFILEVQEPIPRPQSWMLRTFEEAKVGMEKNGQSLSPMAYSLMSARMVHSHAIIAAWNEASRLFGYSLDIS